MDELLFSLYDPEIKRIIRVLNQLQGLKKRTNLIDFSNQVAYSIPSTLNYLRSIQQRIQNLHLEKVQLKLNSYHEISWQLGSSPQYCYLKSSFINQCLMVNLGKRILLGEKVNRRQFIAANFLTDNTFKRKFALLKRFFMHYQLQVVSHNNYIQVYGDESLTRILATNYLAEAYSYQKWPEELTIPQAKVESLLTACFRGFGLEFQQNKFYKTKLALAVQFLRIDRGYLVKLSSQIQANFPLIELLKERVFNFSELDLPFTEENYFIVILLATDYLFQTCIGRQALYVIQGFPNPLQSFLNFVQNRLQEVAIRPFSETKIQILVISTYFSFLLSAKAKEKRTDSRQLVFSERNQQLAVDLVQDIQEKFPDLVGAQTRNLVGTYSKLLNLIQIRPLVKEVLCLKIQGTESLLDELGFQQRLQEQFSRFYKLNFASQEPDLILILSGYYQDWSYNLQQRIIYCPANQQLSVQGEKVLQMAFLEAMQAKRL
ncbi:hypothetical protein HU830_06845 [Lactobacillus sp. DCY120]|uniref:Mga helix-turn-helix domain-containing protein n=1 Tax=Bombilactobacillus apium TaxID=2675299 RepID=A0A850R8K5_9LACO|nr:hypothetical protein [Bombilactobacillus apium]NVY96865.1 hypothetical protein [Bombilactobacillus apium]